MLLPSSTLPAVMKRRARSGRSRSSEIPFFLAALHQGIRGAVVHARGAAFADGHGQRLADDVGGGGGASLSTGQVRSCRPRCGSAPAVSTTRRPRGGVTTVTGTSRPFCGGSPGARARAVQARQRDALARDVLPDVQLGPVLIGNARKCSPGRIRVLNSVHSSGALAFGCHWPKLSRWLKMRSLARLFPVVAPRAADQQSKRCSSPPAASHVWCRCGFARVRQGAPCRARMESSTPTTDGARPSRRRGGRGTRSLPGSCGRCRRAAAGRAAPLKGGEGNRERPSRPGAAPRESLAAPENSSAGRSKAATTSRRMKMVFLAASRGGWPVASSSCSTDVAFIAGLGVIVRRGVRWRAGLAAASFHPPTTSGRRGSPRRRRCAGAGFAADAGGRNWSCSLRARSVRCSATRRPSSSRPAGELGAALSSASLKGTAAVADCRGAGPQIRCGGVQHARQRLDLAQTRSRLAQLEAVHRRCLACRRRAAPTWRPASQPHDRQAVALLDARRISATVCGSRHGVQRGHRDRPGVARDQVGDDHVFGAPRLVACTMRRRGASAAARSRRPYARRVGRKPASSRVQAMALISGAATNSAPSPPDPAPRRAWQASGRCRRCRPGRRPLKNERARRGASDGRRSTALHRSRCAPAAAPMVDQHVAGGADLALLKR